jgi:hypothetical protein
MFCLAYFLYVILKEVFLLDNPVIRLCEDCGTDRLYCWSDYFCMAGGVVILASLPGAVIFRLCLLYAKSTGEI